MICNLLLKKLIKINNILIKIAQNPCKSCLNVLNLAIILKKGAFMTKADFISQVAQTAGLTKKDATAATDAVIVTISDVLAKGDSISFIGFGTFSVAERAARTARVPSTGKTINVPATKVAKFKVGKNLKDAVAAAKATKKAKK